MRRIESKAAGKFDWLAALAFCGLQGLLWLCLPFIPDNSPRSGSQIGVGWSTSIGLCFIAAGAVASRGLYKLRGLGAFVAEEGVGALVNGEQTWCLDWNHFGGVQRVRQRLWDSLWRPHRGGLHILDRNGLIVGTLPVGVRSVVLQSSGKAAILESLQTRMMIEALNSRAPANAPTIDLAGPHVRRLPLSFARLLLAGGLVTLCSTGYFTSVWFKAMRGDEPALGFLGTGWATLTITLGWIGGTIAAFVGGVDLYARKHPEYDKARLPKPKPEEGPHINEHYLARSGRKKMTELREGVRYKVVHPEAMRDSIRTQMQCMRLLVWLCLGTCAIAVLLLCFVGKASDLLPGLAIIALFGLLALLPKLSSHVYAERLHSLDDTIVQSGDQIVVVKPNGSHLSFGPKAKRRRLLAVENVEELKENGVRYYLDRAHLYESQVSLDHEELRERP